MPLIINDEIIEDEVIEGQFVKAYNLIPQAQQNEQTKQMTLQYIKNKIIENTLLKQVAESKFFDIPYSSIKAEYEKMINHYGGIESFSKKINTFKRDELSIKNQIEENLKIESLLKQWTKDIPDSPEKDLLDFYERKKKELYRSNERVVVSILLANKSDVEAISQIEKLYQFFLKNGDYEELIKWLQSAREQSQNSFNKIEYKSKVMIEKGSLAPEIEEVIFQMQRGEVSELIKMGNEIAIFRYIDYIPESVWKYNEVRNKVQYDFNSDKRQTIIKNKLVDLKQKASLIDNVNI